MKKWFKPNRIIAYIVLDMFICTLCGCQLIFFGTIHLCFELILIFMIVAIPALLSYTIYFRQQVTETHNSEEQETYDEISKDLENYVKDNEERAWNKKIVYELSHLGLGSIYDCKEASKKTTHYWDIYGVTAELLAMDKIKYNPGVVTELFNLGFDKMEC
eukprot:309421_1